MSSRYNELDSIRGLAAVSVMFCHLAEVPIGLGIVGGLASTPLHIIWAGRAAVIYFFVLSGFVLSLPFYNGHNDSYLKFVIKRFIRIYVPYYVAVVFALVLASLFSRHGISGLSSWFNSIWTSPLTVGLVVNHLILLGSFKSFTFDPVIWSLSHEMRISLIFPLLVIVVRRVSWKMSLTCGVALSLVADLCKSYLFHHVVHYPNYLTAYTDTLHYILMFVAGALLAKHRTTLVSMFQKQKTVIKSCLMLVGLLFYTYPYWFLPQISLIHKWIVDDWCITVGASTFIVASLGSVRLSRVLLFRPLHFIGKMSYSFYLYHAICLFTLFNILFGKIPTWQIYVLIVCSSFMISALAYYYVELPAIRLTKRVRSSRMKLPHSLKSAQVVEQE